MQDVSKAFGTSLLVRRCERAMEDSWCTTVLGTCCDMMYKSQIDDHDQVCAILVTYRVSGNAEKGVSEYVHVKSPRMKRERSKGSKAKLGIPQRVNKRGRKRKLDTCTLRIRSQHPTPLSILPYGSWYLSIE
jgi:hypothetical protein